MLPSRLPYFRPEIGRPAPPDATPPAAAPPASARQGSGPLVATLLAAAVLASGCGSSRTGSAAASRPGPAAATSAPSARGAAAGSAATSSAAPQSGSRPASQSSVAQSSVAPSVRIPPYLCDATDAAQNAADAYMGALSAGNESQAIACVLPHSVPTSVTRGLLASRQGTAVYLPRDGVDGPAVFGYQGAGKSIDVTVTRQRDGKFWVTGVAVTGG
jgi:hypothetical protein